MCVLSVGWFIKDLLLLIEKSSPYDGSTFPLLLSECSFTICPTPYTGTQDGMCHSI